MTKGQLRAGVERVQANLQARPAQVVADGGFTSRETIMELSQRGIDFIGSLSDGQAIGASGLKTHEIDPEFSGQAFRYEAAQDTYRCPAGQTLRLIAQDRRRAGVVQYQYRAERQVC